MRGKSFALPKTNCCGKKNTTSETAEIINVLVRNPIMRGCYLRILCYKRKTTSWKICLRGMVPWKPKSGRVLISTNQDRIFLDLVLDKVQMFPLHAPELGKRKESWRPFLSYPGSPVCHPNMQRRMPRMSPPCVWPPTGLWVKAGALYPYGLTT